MVGWVRGEGVWGGSACVSRVCACEREGVVDRGQLLRHGPMCRQCSLFTPLPCHSYSTEESVSAVHV